MLVVPRRTERLLVRPLCPDDRAAFVAAMRASAVLHAPWMPSRPPEADFDWLFDRQWEGHSTGRCCKLVAELPDGMLAAFVNLNDIVRGVTESCNAGWSVNALVGGKGFATEAVGALLDVAFGPAPEGLGLHRVAAGIMPENLASLRVAQKCGFRVEGFAPKLIRIAGQWRDHVLLAKLAEEHEMRSVIDTQ